MLNELSLAVLGIKPLYSAVAPSVYIIDTAHSNGPLNTPGLFICLVVITSKGEPNIQAVIPAPAAHIR